MKNEDTHHGQPIEEHKDVFDVWRSHNLGTTKVRWDGTKVVEAPKKRRLVQAPFKAAIHSKCCIGGFRETGLALVIVLRCD